MNTLLSILLPTSLVGGVLIAIVKYYDNVKKICADIISFFAATFGWFKTKSTQTSVESICQLSINDINTIVPELDLPKLSLKWAKKDENGNVVIKPGEAIVLLKYNKDNCQNIINTTSLYVKKALLPLSKPFMDEGVKKAVDFSVIRNFLYKSDFKNYMIPQLIEENKQDIDQYNEIFDKVSIIEKEGLFSRILLREFAVWGNKIATEIPNEDHKKESVFLMDFIYNIASREYDELTPLSCVSNNVKVAVLLVAKYETYYEKGIAPYVRRIKEGFSKGITTFYLLARNEKIDILEKVYGELIASGNYVLQNGPKIYKDEYGRNNICYCIEIKKDGDLAIAYRNIDEAIQEHKIVDINITNVFTDKLFGVYNGIDVRIPINEISSVPELKLKNYYSEGMTIQAIPLSVEAKGVIIASLLSTQSEPKSLVSSKYELGGIVDAVVEYADDDFIKLRVKDSNQQAIAFRQGLTYSRYGLLHELFQVGSEIECIIREIDYISNVLIVNKSNLSDPWNNVVYKNGESLECTIFNKKDTVFETELPGDYYAILPFSELSWIDSEIDELKAKIKRNSIQTVRIKKINKDERIIILSKKNIVSNYQNFYDSLKPYEYKVQCEITEKTSYGLIGKINKKYKVFIPDSECHIGDEFFNYKVGRAYTIMVKDVADDKRSLIGSFRPFITPPLQSFSDKYSVGHIFNNLQMTGSFKTGVSFRIKYAKTKEARAVLFNSDISDLCYVNNSNRIFENGFTCPLCIKKIDKEKNNVILCLKEILAGNRCRIEEIEWGKIVYGRVLGEKNNNYIVLLEGYWTDALLESNNHLNIGQRVEMMKASSNSFYEPTDNK